MAAQRSTGETVLFDDYREAYYWLRQNTPSVSFLSLSTATVTLRLSYTFHMSYLELTHRFFRYSSLVVYLFFKDAKIMSWWDYGYQITAIANRTVLVDNNTWNNTHIGRVGQAMASSEEDAYEILRELDVDYVLVIFGGASSYSSDGNALVLRVSVTPIVMESSHHLLTAIQTFELNSKILLFK